MLIGRLHISAVAKEKPTPPTIEGLQQICNLLIRLVRDLQVTSESLRVLLEQRSVFSHEEYEAMCAHALEEWRKSVSAASVEGSRIQADAELQRLLEDLEGPFQ